MSQDQNPPPKQDDPKTEAPARKAPKKTARVVCANNNEFWTTQKQFWAWVRDEIVTYQHDNPLTGKFEGRREKLIVMVNHVLLDSSAPEHKHHVLRAYGLQKPRRPKYPKRPVGKRPR